jgi:hypothetical protein
MEIIRSEFQEPKNQTLDEDILQYFTFPPNPRLTEKQTLLNVIRRLTELTDSKRAYVSVGENGSVKLVAQDVANIEESYLVSFSILTFDNYFSAHVSYRVPDHAAPWNNAYVHTSAHSEDDLVQMILKAIDLSEGWHEKTFG